MLARKPACRANSLLYQYDIAQSRYTGITKELASTSWLAQCSQSLSAPHYKHCSICHSRIRHRRSPDATDEATHNFGRLRARHPTHARPQCHAAQPAVTSTEATASPLPVPLGLDCPRASQQSGLLCTAPGCRWHPTTTMHLGDCAVLWQTHHMCVCTAAPVYPIHTRPAEVHKGCKGHSGAMMSAHALDTNRNSDSQKQL